jgi:anti-sigma B factor antagonist
MLGDTIGPVVECPETRPPREEPAMSSPVFSIPLMPRQPDRPSLAFPPPRGPRDRSPTCLGDLESGFDADFDTDFDTDFDEAGTPLAVAVDDRGGVFVVHADGEVDLSTAPLLDGALDAGLASGRRTVVVDLRQVSFIDCTGIGLLTGARCRARRQGTRLHIHAGRAVARTAALLDLTVTLGLHETLAIETERSA